MKRVDVHFANSILNEVLNGFRVPSFASELGMSESDASKLFGRVHKLAIVDVKGGNDIALSDPEARFFCNALKCTLKELGQDEFQTRTGFDFEQGETILRQLVCECQE